MEAGMLDMACRFVYGMGLSVIPMGDDKKPLIQWKQYQDERPTATEMV